MGRTVINETENKQTIILNDSPEGVEGGYFDSLMKWHELGGSSINEIRVLNGYSINSGTGEITENAARAVSDPIPFTSESVNIIQQYVPSGYKARPFFYTDSETYINQYITVVTPSLIGTSTAWTGVAFNNISSGVIGLKPSNQNWENYSGNAAFIRFLFEKENGTDLTSAADIDGYAYINGVVYHLKGE